VILPPTFAGKKTAIMPLVKGTPMTWTLHCRDSTNRVNYDAVWRASSGNREAQRDTV
jgi:hypothetical protein